MIEQPALAVDERFNINSQGVCNTDALNAIIESYFAHLTAADVIARLEHAGIANARLNTVQEFWDHPQFAARDRWREVESEAGPLKALLPPVTTPDYEPRMEPVPSLGAHTEQILRSLGYTGEQIEQLRSQGAI